MATMTVTLPDALSESEARKLFALKLYEEGHASSGKAAEIAGLSKRDFLLLLGEQGLPVFDQSAEELESDFRNARSRGQQHKLPDSA